MHELGTSEKAMEDAKEIINTISSHPLGGDKTLLLPEYGSIYAIWGMDIGAFLLIAAGIALAISGAMQMMTGVGNIKN